VLIKNTGFHYGCHFVQTIEHHQVTVFLYYNAPCIMLPAKNIQLIRPVGDLCYQFGPIVKWPDIRQTRTGTGYPVHVHPKFRI